MYFESHAHYNDKAFNEDRDELITNLQKEIRYIVNSGENMKSAITGIQLADKYDFLYIGVGVHPHEASKMKQEDINTLRELCKHPKVVAIGEIGLDFHYNFSPQDEQRKWFIAQLELAKEVGLPVIIHSREASQETYDIIKESSIKKGVIHCFSGSSEMALKYIELGYYIGIGGVITFPNSKKLVQVVETIDIENILIETDCPYLTPIPNRGKRNDSSNLKYIAKKIAEIKKITEQEVAEITMQNGLKLWDKIKQKP